jgi:hypothetical protein
MPLAEGDRGRLMAGSTNAVPGWLPAPRSGRSKKRRRIRRRGESSGGSAGSSKMRSTGCVSSRDSLPQRLRRTCRRTRGRKRRATGGGPLLRGGFLCSCRQAPQRRQRSRRPRRSAPAAGRLAEEVARTTKAPVSATGAPASAVAAATGAVGAPPEPTRKRKRGFPSSR